MKTAVVIDYKKIASIREKLSRQDYVRHAIDQLAYEIMWLF